MAEDMGDRIVERLKQEGQLTRNSGTNSIKSVRTELIKFDAVFESINSNIAEQTQILRETLQLQMDEAGRAERARQLEEARRSSTQGGGPGGSGSPTPPSPPVPPRGGNGSQGGLVSGLASLFGGGIGGFGGAAIAGTALAALRRPLRTALLTVVAPSVGKLLGELTEAGLTELGVDTEVATSFGQAANFAGLAGMVGLAFGKRMGLVAAAGGAAASFGDEVLDAMGLDKDSMINLFGTEMKLETAAQGLLGAIGASVTGVITSPSFRSSLTNFFKDSVDADGNPLSRFPRRRALIGSTIGAAVLGAYLTYGNDVKKWLGKQGMPQDFADTTVDVVGLTASFASMGAMFGPTGAIVGAALGLTIGLGKAVYDWFTDNKQKAREKFAKEVASMDPLDASTLASDLAKQGPASLPSGAGAMGSAEVITTIGERAGSGTGAGVNDVETERLIKEYLKDPSIAINREALYARMDNLLDIVENASEHSPEQLAIAQAGLRLLRTGGANAIIGMNDRVNEGRMLRADAIMIGQDIIENLIEPIREAMEEYQFNTGTKGFMNFGPGTFAVLHGREAVVPESTPAGQFLKNYFDENWQPLMSRVNEVANAAGEQFAGNVTYAPVTVAPITNNNVRGGSSSTVINSLGKNNQDLDRLSRPGGVQ